MTALVSIVIPCYNAERWIAATIDSAIAQTWPRTEIIVVNDGSRDGSLAAARTFEKFGVRVIDQPNRGAPAARNAGLAAAAGDYIQFLDADDLIAPDKIEQQMRLAGECGPEFLVSGSWGRFRDKPSEASFPPQPLCRDAGPVDWLVLKFETGGMMHPAAWLTSRLLAVRAGPWDENRDPDDDGEYFARVVLASKGVRFCRESVSYYRSGLAGSLSGAGSDEAWTSIYRSHALTAGRLRRAEESARTRHACASMFQRFIYESYPWAAESRRRAAAEVAALGGSRLQPEGGPKFQLARHLVGWRLARRIAMRLSR